MNCDRNFVLIRLLTCFAFLVPPDEERELRTKLVHDGDAP